MSVGSVREKLASNHADASTSSTPFIDQPQRLIKCKPCGNLLYRFFVSPPDMPNVHAAQMVSKTALMPAGNANKLPHALPKRLLALLPLGRMLPAGNTLFS